MSRELGVLRDSGWLAEQPNDFRDAIAGIGRWRRLPAGHVLWQPGDPADAMFGVGDGAVEHQYPLDPDFLTPTYWAERGAWFGDSETLAGAARLGAMTVAREAALFVVPGRALRALLDRRPDWWRHLYALRVRNTGRILALAAEALALSTSGRVARQLLALAGTGAEVAITQSELAPLVGATRASVGRALTELAADGLLERGYGRIRILDRKGLARILGPRG